MAQIPIAQLGRPVVIVIAGLICTACVMQEDSAPLSDRSAEVQQRFKVNQQQAQAHRQIGLGLEVAGDITGAVGEFEAAIELGSWQVDPDAGGIEESPYGDLTRICRSSDSMQLVIRTCTRVITSFRYSQSDLAEFLVNRADAFFGLSDIKRATRDYETALELESSYPRALFGRGQVRALAGSHNFALTDFDRAIGAGLDIPETRYARAVSHADIGEYEEAIEDFDHVLSDPEGLTAYPDSYRGRAQAHCQAGMAAASATDWQIWIGSTPDGAAQAQGMLSANGYLDAPTGEEFGSAELAALRSWTDAGCPEP